MTLSVLPVRSCPKCGGERPVTEQHCRGSFEGKRCGYPLMHVVPTAPRATVAGPAAPTTPPPTATMLRCPKGHPMEPGLEWCDECGDYVTTSPGPVAVARESGSQDGVTQGAPSTEPDAAARIVGAWRLGQALSEPGHVRQRFVAEHVADGRSGVLTLYAAGAEPDQAIYEVLRAMDLDHVPELVDTGRADGQAFEVTEHVAGGTIAALRTEKVDAAVVRSIVFEMSKALMAFAERGLRHRDLRPNNILVRAREPLDLVITGFGSARLAEYDLEIASTLENTRYTAPEAMAEGGVAAASDWWSLGMLILELVTEGECFAGVAERVFIIDVITRGVAIPKGLDPEVEMLLRGLLVRDRDQRWQGPQVSAWLDGKAVDVPAYGPLWDSGELPVPLRLGGVDHRTPQAFARAAVHAWDEAKQHLLHGAIATWLSRSEVHAQTVAALRQIADFIEVSEDLRLAVALRRMDRDMPLVRGDIAITPGWLRLHPVEGYELIAGPVPDLLESLGIEIVWLLRLARRARAVRTRAAALGIELVEDVVREYLLGEHAWLAAMWNERRSSYPDAAQSGLASILERHTPAEEDLVILLSAADGQFIHRDDVLDEVTKIASAHELGLATPERLSELLDRSHSELLAVLDARIHGFARCGDEQLDGWADQFRLRRTLSLARVLVLLSIAPEQWQCPPHQRYVSRLMGFFAQRVMGAILHGPLVRMTIGKTTARVDLMELGRAGSGGLPILEHVLQRGDRRITIDPAVFVETPELSRRVRSLVARTTTYRRDTGIDGLFLGFPFVLHREPGTKRRPRIAPVLLWPVSVQAEHGSRSRVEIAFDRDREEVRLNPALAGLFEDAKRWQDVTDRLLGRASALRAHDVLDGFGTLAPCRGAEMESLPDKDTRLVGVDTQLVHAAVLFHAEFVGQAIAEDLRYLEALPPAGSALATLLRIADHDHATPTDSATSSTVTHHLVADSDPSQDRVLAQAWNPRGLFIHGPPGTGKSQTIVNLVGDAIGYGRSLLIVCQKLPALEVVEKRLIAEGLGERILKITDVNKDRQRVLRQIRAQLEQLRERDPVAQRVNAVHREDLLARMLAAERWLDERWNAENQVHPTLGWSYRDLLAELIDLQSDALGRVEFPGLATVVAGLTPAEVAELEEACGAVAPAWLAARYEGSPLAVITGLRGDPSRMEHVRERIVTLWVAEQLHDEALTSTTPGMETETPEELKAWLDHAREPMESLTPAGRRQLARYLPLFRGAGAGSEYLRILTQLEAVARTRAHEFEVPGLDARLQRLRAEQLAALPDACATLAELWSKARYEGSPLSALAPSVPTTEAHLDALREQFSRLSAAEEHRARAGQRLGPFETDDPDAFEAWILAHAPRLRAVESAELGRLQQWSGLLRDPDRRAVLVHTVEHLQARIAQIPEVGVEDSLDRLLMALTDGELHVWVQAAAKATAPGGALAWLDPGRLLARRKVRQLLSKQGVVTVDDASLADFATRTRRETTVRTLVAEWATTTALLFPTERVGARPPLSVLRVQVATIHATLNRLIEVVAMLDACPHAAELWQVVGTILPTEGSRALVEACAGAVLRARARHASLHALAELCTSVEPDWLRAYQERIACHHPPGDLLSLIESLPLLPAYQEFRRQLRRCDDSVRGVFADLAQVREPLLAASGRDLGATLGAVVSRHTLRLQRHRLLAADPRLATADRELGPDPSQRLAVLSSLEASAQRLAECPEAEAADAAAACETTEALAELFVRFDGAVARGRTRMRVQAALVDLEGMLDGDWLLARVEAVEHGRSDVEPVRALHDALPHLAAYQRFERRAAALTVRQRQALTALAPRRSELEVIPATDMGRQVQRIIRRVAFTGYKRQLEDEAPALLAEASEVVEKIRRLDAAETQMRQLNRVHLGSAIDPDRIGRRTDWENITRLQGPRARRLREFFELGVELGLLAMRPVWLMTPDVASQLLPRTAGHFDLVIYDEASQMPLQMAIATLFRARSVVVCGDDKQMPPTSFFRSRVEDNEKELFDGEVEDDAAELGTDAIEEVWNRKEIEGCPDLLSLAQASEIPTVRLMVHYRSRHRELIGFSNSAFYGGQLAIPVRHPPEEVRRARPIEMIRVDGEYEEQVNPDEAGRVVDVLAELWQVEPAARPSVGVVTFNRKQADLIEEKLEERAEVDTAFRRAYAEESERTEDGEYMGVFVKNVENVQGDERDVIVFSTTFGRTSAGFFRRSFGVLGQGGGQRRLNVAVTRAREKIKLVTSIPIARVSDFLATRRELVGPRDYLQAYLEYARLVSEGQLEAAQALCARVSSAGASGAPHRATSKPDGFVRSVQAYLHELGHEPVATQAREALGVDLAIEDRRTGHWGIGIECGVPQHPLLLTARAREIWRPRLLRRTYPVVYRIAANAWYNDPDGERLRLRAAVEASLSDSP